MNILEDNYIEFVRIRQTSTLPAPDDIPISVEKMPALLSTQAD